MSNMIPTEWGLSRIGKFSKRHATNIDLQDNGQDIVIGRNKVCGIILISRLVSRQHAYLRKTNGHWCIVDLNSLNGIYVNGVKIPPSTLYPLKEGDRFGVGVPEAEADDQYQFLLYKKTVVAAPVKRDIEKIASNFSALCEEVSIDVPKKLGDSCNVDRNVASTNIVVSCNEVSSTSVIQDKTLFPRTGSKSEKSGSNHKLSDCYVCVSRCDSPSFVLPESFNSCDQKLEQLKKWSPKNKSSCLNSTLKRRHSDSASCNEGPSKVAQKRRCSETISSFKEIVSKSSQTVCDRNNQCNNNEKEKYTEIDPDIIIITPKEGTKSELKSQFNQENLSDAYTSERKIKTEKIDGNPEPQVDSYLETKVKIEPIKLVISNKSIKVGPDLSQGYSQEDEIIVISDDEDNFVCSSMPVIKTEPNLSAVDEESFVNDYLPQSLGFDLINDIDDSPSELENDTEKEKYVNRHNEEQETILEDIALEFPTNENKNQEEKGDINVNDFFPLLSQTFSSDDEQDIPVNEQQPTYTSNISPQCHTSFSTTNDISISKCASRRIEIVDPLPMTFRPRFQRGREEWFSEKQMNPKNKKAVKCRIARKANSFNNSISNVNNKNDKKKKSKSLKEKIREQMNHRIPVPGGGSAIPVKESSKTFRSQCHRQSNRPAPVQKQKPISPKNSAKNSSEVANNDTFPKKNLPKPQRFPSRMEFLTKPIATSTITGNAKSLSDPLKTYKIPKKVHFFSSDESSDILNIQPANHKGNPENSQKASKHVAPTKTLNYSPASAIKEKMKEKHGNTNNQMNVNIPDLVIDKSKNFSSFVEHDSNRLIDDGKSTAHSNCKASSVPPVHKPQQLVSILKKPSIQPLKEGLNKERKSIQMIQDEKKVQMECANHSSTSKKGKREINKKQLETSISSNNSMPNVDKISLQSKCLLNSNKTTKDQTNVKIVEQPSEVKSSDTSSPLQGGCMDPRIESRKMNSVFLHSNKRSTRGHPASEPTAPPVTKPSKSINIEKILGTILSWKVQWLKQQINFSAPPPVVDFNSVYEVKLSYDSYDDFLNTFLPLLYLETWEALFTAWRECCIRNSHIMCPLTVLSSEFQEDLLTILCETVITPQVIAQESYPQEGHILIMDVRLKGNENNAYRVFGYVQSCKLEIIKDGKQPSHPESSKLMPKSSDAFLLTLKVATKRKYCNVSTEKIMSTYVACYLKPIIRQYEAILNLHHYPLVRDILRPRLPNCRIPLSTSATSVPCVSGSYNGHQMKAIVGAASAMCRPYPIPQIALIQGPPGTGKTHVLIGIIEQLLMSEKCSPTQPVKLLVTAPSNAAVDEITRRLVCLKQQLQLKGSKRKIRFVRVGQPSQIHPDVRRYWLDELVQMNIQEQEREEFERTKLDIREMEAKIHSLEHSLETLKQRGASNQNIEKNEAKLSLVHKKLSFLQKEQPLKKASEQELERKKKKLRMDILQNADIILSTLNSCRQMVVETAFRGTNTPFISCCLVDEASQCTEPELLIPLTYGMCKMVLIGDPRQLPATVLSHTAAQKNFQQSLMERFSLYFRNLSVDNPIFLLTEQYRMHPEICQFPSEHFYNNALYTSNIISTQYPLEPYMLFDIKSGKENTNEPCNIYNMEEAFLVVRLVSVIYRCAPEKTRINIITPYHGQRRLFEDLIGKENLVDVTVSTVDSFQGQESDIIVLSCVRAQNFSGSIGFVASPQRMNVAITRAKHALYLCGHLDSLRTSKHWEDLIKNAVKRSLIRTISSDTPVKELKNLVCKKSY